MGKQEASPLHNELIQGEKKLSKRKHHLQDRLEKAREAKERAEERLQRMQARLQKRVARVQKLEEKLGETRQQLQEIRTAAQAINVDMPAPDMTDIDTSATISILPVEEPSPQEHPDTEAGGETNVLNVVQTMDLAALSEAIVQAQDARCVAEIAEEAARVAIERSQVVEARLNQFGTARHLEHELAQMQIEARQAQQVAWEKEQVAQEAERLIWPITLADVDEESEEAKSETCLESGIYLEEHL
ncbi:MAG: hypothetical protein NVSMB44_19010 [Ktedonobacteraceae bacterium]